MYNHGTTTSIAATGLKLSAIGPRPGTTAFATEAHLKKDEVHVAVIDESTNTVVERFTFLSNYLMLSLQKSILFYRDVINAQSRLSMLVLQEAGLTAAGNGWGGTAASYAATAAAPETMGSPLVLLFLSPMMVIYLSMVQTVLHTAPLKLLQL